MSPPRAVFLDRDGVLNDLVIDPISGVPESPLDVAEVRLADGAAAGARALAQAGFLLICVSNQPAAAKGRVSVERIHRIHERVLELLALEGVELATSRLCLHHPQGVVPKLSRICVCRKPAPGMLLEAGCALGVDRGMSWMVGDTDADIEAGRAAGSRTLLIEHVGSRHKRLQGHAPDLRAPDLACGAPLLLRKTNSSFCTRPTE